MRDCTRSNTGESSVISNWFGLHQTISHFFGDISVILDLWGCFWGLCGVLSSKSRILSCCIGNMELLSTQCRGILPHFSLKGKSHGFSRLGQEPGVYSRVMVGWHFNTHVSSATLAILSSYDGYLRNQSSASQDNTDTSRSEEWHRGSLSIWHSDIGIPNNIQKFSGIVNIWSSELHLALEISKGYEAPFRVEVET